MEKQQLYKFFLSLLAISALLFGQITENDLTQAGQEELAKRGLTLEQVQNRARQIGIDLSNPELARQQAQARGIPKSKIDEWLRLYNVNQKKSAAAPQKITLNKTQKAAKQDTIKTRTRQDSTQQQDKESVKKSPYFGYDLFKNVPQSFSPAETGPVNEGYVIAPEDELRLTLWGGTEFQYELKVDKEGRIFVPNVGQFTIANMKLQTARKQLKNWLSRKYGGLAESPPTIFMDLTVTRLKPIKIFVLGEVKQPGGYTISSYATAFNALYSVGGPKTSGSLRTIRIIRNGKVIDTVDFYDYLVKGQGQISEKLQNNDKIFVPVRGKTVKIAGQVNRPAIFELKPSETLKDLINFAGGITPQAYTKRVQIKRIIPFNLREDHNKLRKIRDYNFTNVLEGNTSINLENGDKVTVRSISEVLDNYVTINGPVYSPGRYELNSSINNIKNLILAADSLKDDVYWHRAEVYRLQKDSTRKLIKIDLTKTIAENPNHNLKLEPRDIIQLFSMN